MFSLIGAGVLLIMVNYMGLLPGGHNHDYLFVGLGSIAAGFVMALHYR